VAAAAATAAEETVDVSCAVVDITTASGATTAVEGLPVFVVEPSSSYIFPVAESYLTFCGLTVARPTSGGNVDVNLLAFLGLFFLFQRGKQFHLMIFPNILHFQENKKTFIVQKPSFLNWPARRKSAQNFVFKLFASNKLLKCIRKNVSFIKWPFSTLPLCDVHSFISASFLKGEEGD